MKPELTLIAAVDENLLLATAQGIPWKLPDDVAHFRAYCAGKWLLLGRHTYEDMTGWFKPDQHPLVLTSTCGYEPNPGRGVAPYPRLWLSRKPKARRNWCASVVGRFLPPPCRTPRGS
ncbi:dihydrofolate reductase [Verrucomicrobium spinosum]|uniref:dihydrofolate reductase n=1 Tax=Verrucomicrobium spinosum TaxID=2736 RepID=UPI000B03807B|nr:dihydrofolate reductase [Verrucomicrobium spinosum]